MDRRPPARRSADGRSASPLLRSSSSSSDAERGRTYTKSPRRSGSSPPPTPSPRRPFLARRATIRSASPTELGRAAARRKYTYAAFFFLLVLVAFAAQTELSAYIQTRRGWNKAYCMLYLTHGSWAMLWPAQLAILRLRRPGVPWHVFWRRHVQLLRSTATIVEAQRLDVDGGARRGSPVTYMVRTTAAVTTALTVAWLMILEGLLIPAYAMYTRRGGLAAQLRPHARLGLLGAALSLVAYGLVLWAQTRAALAPVAALRESSIVVGAAIGTVFFKERFGKPRIAAAGLLVVGIGLMLHTS